MGCGKKELDDDCGGGEESGLGGVEWLRIGSVDSMCGEEQEGRAEMWPLKEQKEDSEEGRV